MEIDMDMRTGVPLTILLIEDNFGDYRLVREMLEDCAPGGFNLLHADQVAAAMPLIEREALDIIILDLGLPDGSGLDTLLKVHALAPQTPIVVLSQAEDEAMAVRAVAMGAQDFLVKSHISGLLLTRALRYALERRQLEEHLHRIAHRDVLTGLPNRKMFYDHFGRALAAARRHRRPLALLLLDLNRFKRVNDTLGHQVGDDLLRQVAGRLASCVRSTDCVARLGGDEFVIYTSDLAEIQDVARVADKLFESLAEPCRLEGREHLVQCSLGIAVYPKDGEEIETLVRHADVAMYAAKAQGDSVSCYRFYSPELDSTFVERTKLEAALRHAFETGGFLVNYQAQVDLHSGRVVGVETLLRWRRDDGEIVLPTDFMATLEESGLIVEVGGWVMEVACLQAAGWSREHVTGLKVAVNISPRQFRDPRLAERVSHALRASGLDPRLLELELSEVLLRDNESLAMDVLQRLNALGVRIALDNYCGRAVSLRDLKHFPIHSIKLDRIVVGGMTDSVEDAARVQAIISVAHVLRMKGIAEGVETQRQIELLRSQTCDDAQGYAFSRPLSSDAFGEFLRGIPAGVRAN